MQHPPYRRFGGPRRGHPSRGLSRLNWDGYPRAGLGDDGKDARAGVPNFRSRSKAPPTQNPRWEQRRKLSPNHTAVCLSVCQGANKELLKFSPCLFPSARSSVPNTEQSRPRPPNFELESLCSELWVVLPIQAFFFPDGGRSLVLDGLAWSMPKSVCTSGVHTPRGRMLGGGAHGSLTSQETETG